VIGNVLTIDLEEHFHSTEVQRRAGEAGWKQYPLHIEEQTERIRELLDRNG
jgi:hypothetical protein